MRIIKTLFIVFGLLFSTTLFAQNITGKVIDNQGAVVVNALVCQSEDWSVWTKSDSQGEFSLAGEIGNELRVAALHFQTVNSVTVSSTTDLEITLLKDELLDSDVYHISFDHLRPGDYYSKEELKDDFPVPSGAGFYQPGNETTNRAFVDNQESIDPEGQSLRVRFPAGQLKTANSGVDARIPLANTYKNNDFDGEELYLSYWIKFSDNFQFDKCGGKLPSLGGSDLGVRENEWKGRIMWRNGGSIQFYMELPHGEDKFEHDSLRFWGDKEFDGGDICTNEFTSYLASPGWHNIELHYKMDNGTPIGLFEGWVDGDKGHKIINSEVFGFYRRAGEGLDNLTTNAILLSAFLGGSSEDYEPTEDVFAWFDEFRVSRTRINEYSKYNNVITSIANNTIQKTVSVYPNPNDNGVFYLETNTAWSVFNTVGEKVKTGDSSEIDISDQEKGVYLVQVGSNKTKVIYQ